MGFFRGVDQTCPPWVGYYSWWWGREEKRVSDATVTVVLVVEKLSHFLLLGNPRIGTVYAITADARMCGVAGYRIF